MSEFDLVSPSVALPLPLPQPEVHHSETISASAAAQPTGASPSNCGQPEISTQGSLGIAPDAQGLQEPQVFATQTNETEEVGNGNNRCTHNVNNNNRSRRREGTGSGSRPTSRPDRTQVPSAAVTPTLVALLTQLLSLLLGGSRSTGASSANLLTNLLSSLSSASSATQEQAVPQKILPPFGFASSFTSPSLQDVQTISSIGVPLTQGSTGDVIERFRRLGFLK